MKNLFETEQNPQISIEKLRVIEKLFIPRFLYTNVKVEHTEIMTVVNGQSKDILFSVMKHSFPIKGLNDIGFRLLVEWGGQGARLLPAAKIRWLYQCDDVGRNFQFGGYLDSRYSFACYYDSGLRIGKIAIELDGKHTVEEITEECTESKWRTDFQK